MTCRCQFHRSHPQISIIVAFFVVGIYTAFNNKSLESLFLIPDVADTLKVTGLQEDNDLVPSLSPSLPPQKRTHAFVHMGIHKTGSTSIQFYSSLFADQLEADGYFMPWKEAPNPARLFNADQVNFASCFFNRSTFERQTYFCDPDLLLKGLEFAKSGKNIFLSSETLSLLDSKGIQSLSVYLSNWDSVDVVLYYRRFYSFLSSNFNEQLKARKFTKEPTRQWTDSTENFVPAMEKMLEQLEYHFVAEFMTRMKNGLFPDIHIFDFHDQTDIVESFYCNAFKNAQRTCDAYRQSPKEEHNGSKALWYSDLVYAAYRTGVLNVTTHESFVQLVQATHDHQITTLQRTSGDYPKKCLPPATLERIWEVSLRNQLALFPEHNRTQELREDFEIAARTSLCTIDIELMLQQEEWISFFTSHQL